MRALTKPNLLIIDEIGYRKMEETAAHFFFQIIAERYESGSIILTSNKSYGAWGEIFGDSVLATAILDRLLHHSTTINIKGESKIHLGQLLEEYDLTQCQLEQIEHELHLILKRIPYAQNLLEIRGVNAISLAGVLGEAGDLSGYTHGNALMRHAGLNLTEASFGKWRGKMALSKRGHPRLRHFIYLITMCMVMTNPELCTTIMLRVKS